MAIYEAANAYAPDTQPRYYRELAAELGAVTIVDLGCGTGLITRELARLGHRMIGIDPAPAMLELARHRPYGEHVRWVDGDASQLGTPEADLAIMTGHVAQFFLTDEGWHAALVALHDALRPGGWLAFESRNPGAREWERWTRESRQSLVDLQVGWVAHWSEVVEVRDGIVSYTNHYALAATGEELVSPTELRFRTEAELRGTLAEAGFVIDRIHGDWDRRPAGPRTPELIVVASR